MDSTRSRSESSYQITFLNMSSWNTKFGYRIRTILVKLNTKRWWLWTWRNSVLTEFFLSAFVSAHKTIFHVSFFFPRNYFSKYRIASKHSEHLYCSYLLWVPHTKNVLQVEELISVLGSFLCVNVSNFPSDITHKYCLVRTQWRGIFLLNWTFRSCGLLWQVSVFMHAYFFH